MLPVYHSIPLSKQFLTPVGQDALRGLLVEQLTQEQFELGLRALAAVAAASVRTEALTGGLPDTLRTWYRMPSWPSSRRWLIEHLNELPPDAPALLDAAAVRARSAGNEGEARSLARHAALLNESLRVGVDVTYQTILGEEAFRAEDEEEHSEPEPDAALLQQIVEWVRTPDWTISRAYLKEHATALLTDEAERVLALLHESLQTDERRQIIAAHQQLLRVARAREIDVAYDWLLRNEQRTRVSSTGNAEIDTLFTELQNLPSSNANPRRQEEICRRILQIDSQAHVLDAQLRGAVLGTRGNALQTIAKGVDGDGQGFIALLQQAVVCFDQALLGFRREVAPRDWAVTLYNKGNALRDLAGGLSGVARAQALQQAIACYDQALLEQRREVAPLQWAMALTNKGNTLQTLAEGVSGVARTQALQDAATAYREALSVYPPEVQPGEHRRIARALARTYLLQAAGTESLAAKQVILEQEWQVASSAVAAADLLELQAPALSFRQQEWAKNASLYNLAACVRARQGRLDEAVILIERGRARGLAEAAGRRSADLGLLTSADCARYLLAVQTVQDIEAAGRQRSDPLALVAEAQSANERLAEVVTQLRKAYPGFLTEHNVSISALAGALHPGEALVYLIPQVTDTLLLVVPRGGEPRPKWLSDLSSDDIFKLAVQPDAEGRNREGFLPAALGWHRDDPFALVRALDALLPELGDRLMHMVVQLVRECGCHRAVLVPSGYLSVLPLHAASYEPLAGELPTAPGGRRYACDDLAITYAPSGLVYLAARQAAARQALAGPAEQIFIAGNPQLTRKDDPWTPNSPNYLRYAEWEAQRVSEIAKQCTPPLTVDMALIDEATWTRVVNGLGKSDVAHLALHAAFDVDDPEQSAFLVAFQAQLMLRDLLDPRQARLTRLRLVVLSACQSAISDVSNQSEEAVGLFGALLAGGVPGVIGTLWSVNDLATAALMEAFAQRYLVKGQAPDVALRAAARELRRVADSAADPAEKGPNATPRHTAEDITMIELELTPAMRRWEELAAHDPGAAGATRSLSPEELTAIGQHIQAFRSTPRDHPIYWAAFVFHGASQPLDGESSAGTESVTATRRTAPREITMHDDQNVRNTRDSETCQRAGDEIPAVEERAPGYFPAASEVCPRCHAQDYLPVRAAHGRDLRQCLSCHLIYLPGENPSSTGGNLRRSGQ